MNGACRGGSTCTGTAASCGCAGLGCCLSRQADIKSLEGRGGATLQLQVASWQGWHRGSSQGKGPGPHEREAVDEQKERGPRAGGGRHTHHLGQHQHPSLGSRSWWPEQEEVA